MTGLDEFKNFKVGIPEKLRYWEDESTGVLIKRGQIVEIGKRDFRSAELRFSLMRSQVLLKDGECTFVWRGSIVNIKPGQNKNLITVLSGPDLGEVNKDETTTKVPEKAGIVVPEVIKSPTKIGIKDNNLPTKEKKQKPQRGDIPIATEVKEGEDYSGG